MEKIYRNYTKGVDMLVQGGVINVIGCTACGMNHDNLEMEYSSIKNKVAELTAICPKTGKVVYIYVLVKK